MTKQSRRNITGAGLAGAGGGTGLLVLINLVPETQNELRSFLTYLAPTASVALAALWTFAASRVAHALQRQRLDDMVKRARLQRDAIWNNPSSTQAHKDKAQLAVEKLEMLIFAALEAEGETIRVSVAEVSAPGPVATARPVT